MRMTHTQGADIAVTDMDGKTALHWTANNHDPSSARALLELAPLSVNLRDNEGRTALHLAVVVGNRPVAEALVRECVSVLNECVCVFVCLFLASVCVLLRCMREKKGSCKKVC